MNRIVVISGGFDPLHKGHIQYITDAKRLAEDGGRGEGMLIVGLNSDEWLRRKKGQEFLSFEDRSSIVETLSPVNQCWAFDDDDDTATQLIRMAVLMQQNEYPDAEVMFANGGDRSSSEATPESDYCEENGITCVYGVGGSNKENSSSWILDRWNSRD